MNITNKQRKTLAISFAASIAVATIAVGTMKETETPTLAETKVETEPIDNEATLKAQQELDAFLAIVATTTTTTTLRPQPKTPTVVTGNVWDDLAYCETGGRWDTNTGNGYYGGLQFAATSWTGFGGEEFAPMAHLATREQQIIVAERILARMGFGAWPGCSRKLGLR